MPPALIATSDQRPAIDASIRLNFTGPRNDDAAPFPACCETGHFWNDESMRQRCRLLSGGSHGSRTEKPLVWAAVFAAVIGSMPGTASAVSEVEGQADAIKLRAENASIREVLDALSTKFKLSYKVPPNLIRNMTGEYSGTLNQVLARVLDGNDYVVETSEAGVKIVVLGASGGPASPGSSVATVAALPAPASREHPVAPSASSSRPPLHSSSPNLPAANPSLPFSRPVPPLATYLSTNGFPTAGSAP